MKSVLAAFAQKAMLTVIIASACLIPIILYQGLDKHPRPVAGRRAVAKIVSLDLGHTRHTAHAMTVVARTRNGIEGVDFITLGEFYEHGCKKDDRVYGIVYGDTLEFDALTCRRPTQVLR